MLVDCELTTSQPREDVYKLYYNSILGLRFLGIAENIENQFSGLWLGDPVEERKLFGWDYESQEALLVGFRVPEDLPLISYLDTLSPPHGL